ncbi:hypothetical protein N7510_002041 [Penicillium lagena]|uniref:uncharacterized protein n=1 Tax=Penicillium lagena TaxID=94218 RepID=UPI00254111E6|nr:uncharacterized protein N7510_002041 [Penicillium lagena]KAJ5625732.1 hypothetical protein N7510_002041 [Penicillium lagena]
MATRHEPSSLWWPEERIKSTLNAKYVINHLPAGTNTRLFDSPRWGEGLTSDTYLDWILLKAARLFLILSDIGVPERIFALVDESLDDDNLPIAGDKVHLLHLSSDGGSSALNAKFLRAQWRFLVRGIAEGEHVTYTEQEGVPVEVMRGGNGAGMQGRDNEVDNIVLAGSVCRVLLRSEVQIGVEPHFFKTEEVLEEIRSLRRLAHEHLTSVYASYFVDGTICTLFTGATAERTLHSFLTDEPQSFKKLPKERRREILISWPHCLVSALTWLHAHGQPHGAIYPSNILVDPMFHISLGQFQALDSLLEPPRVHELEAYNYSPPERWVRATTRVQQQTTTPARTELPSGSRTARRKRSTQFTLASLNESPQSSPDLRRPDSAASKGTVIRVGLPVSSSRSSFAHSTSSSSSSTYSGMNANNEGSQHRSSSLMQRPRPRLSIASMTSSNSSSSPTSSSSSSSTPSSCAPARQCTNTVLSIWKSEQTTPLPSDIFSLAAITLDILTHLCKRSLSSFTSHRSARNRTAGRGGGIADASFHLPRNAVQIQSWVALLEGDSKKRCRRKRASDNVFWAVPSMLSLVRSMLQSEPEERPSARQVRKYFADVISQIPPVDGADGVSVHCVSVAESTPQTKRKGGNSHPDKENNIEKHNTAHVKDIATLPSPMSEFDFGFSGDLSGSDANLNHDPADSSPFVKQDQVLVGYPPGGQDSCEDLGYNVTAMGKLSCHEEWVHERKSPGVGS